MPTHTVRVPAPSLLYAVKQVELAVRARLEEVLRPHGVTPLQYTALTVLERRADLTAAELARNSFVTTQSMADLVGALDRLGLIARRPDPQDRRRALINLSPSGRALLASCTAEVDALERRMLSDLDTTEVAALRAALNSCREALSAPRR
ncbi:MarR family winged helix-turn-helix transcriptional regulator [Nocardioides hungaricus]